MRRISNLILVIAALQGGAGVALAAAAAHLTGNGSIAAASQMLMIHAATAVGLASLIRQPLSRANLLAGVASVQQFGVTLFSLDIVCRSYFESRLFAYAAPIGGGLTILCWLALACWALAEFAATFRARD